MDNQTPWQPGQNPEGQGPQEAPPAGPYAPPADYSPPGQPYAPPQDPNAAYGQAPYSPPPQKKGGFNWLACCGISCGVLLLVSILVVVIVGKSCGGLWGPIMEMGKVAQEIEKTDISTIQSSASPLDSASLSADPDSFKGQWLALEGMIGAENDQMAQSMKGQSGQEGTAYFIAPDILVMDISNAPPVGDEGDTIRAYGKAVKFDLKEMLKFMGPEALKELESDPQLQGRTNFVFVFAKQVDLVASGDPPADAAPADGADAAGGAADWGGESAPATP
ncbi:hypothetical protein IT575_01605 [bacterium]|nr:hypothetical protein [bacterium]